MNMIFLKKEKSMKFDKNFGNFFFCIRVYI